MTPAVRQLEQAGVAFVTVTFDHDPGAHDYGAEAAAAIAAQVGDVEPGQVFKTLLVAVDGGHAVAVVPVTAQLSLKSMAAACSAKRADLCDPSVAERLTGYVVGGISPFGQRKRLPAVVDETAGLFDTIYVSGGRRGLDLGIASRDLVNVLAATVAPIASQ